VSRYDLGVAIADAFGLDRELLQSASQKDVQMAAPRPADVSLNIQKALSLGYSPLGYQEELRQIAEGKY
jgi:dTDP-4-dehydrorhamnose reductase